MTALESERCFRLMLDVSGTFDGMTLRAVRRQPPGRGEVEIEIAAAGLNFLDVLLVLGVIPSFLQTAGSSPLPLGLECAGRIVAIGESVTGLSVGQEVVALGPGSFASHMKTSALFVAPRPERISAEQAATIAGAHLTAYYALDKVARLKRGERVLIHAAAGGVGLAALQWAQHVGAQIYATVGSSQKRTYLDSLGVQHLSDSRSEKFVEDVMLWTAGEGVDVVLNSLSGGLLQKSLGLLGEFGRFIELGKRDCMEDTQIGLRSFLKNLTFSLVDLHGLMRHRPAYLNALLYEVMGHVESGTLRPLPYRSFSICQVEDAFRFMAGGQHMGKIVLTMSDPAAWSLLSASTGLRDERPLMVDANAARTVRMSSCELAMAELSARGIQIWLEGDKLRYRAAKSALSAELLASLRIYKEEITAALIRRKEAAHGV